MRQLSADPLSSGFGALPPSHGAARMVPPAKARDHPRRTMPPTVNRDQPTRTVPPRVTRDEATRSVPPAVSIDQPTATRSAENVDCKHTPVKDKKGSSSKTRNIWLSHVSDAEIENANAEADDESGDGPAVDFTLAEVRAEVVSARALAGWGDVSRRTRRPNPDVSRKTSQRTLGRAVPVKVPTKQHSSTTADTDGEEAEALTRKMSAAMPPRRPSLEFRSKRNSVTSFPKRQSGRESFSHPATGSDGEAEGYAESI